MKNIFIVTLSSIILIFIVGQCSNLPTQPLDGGFVTDIDGNIYQTVIIGNQVWMAENLKVTHYRNGDEIPNITGKFQWSLLVTGAYSGYENADVAAETYGYLYNWYSIDDSREIAPEGWHVATDEDWKELEINLGMTQIEADMTSFRGTDEGDRLKATNWGNGTNESGFTALPAGYRISNNSFFTDIGQVAVFWSSSETGEFGAWHRFLYYSGSDINRNFGSKRQGFSVRCVKDK